MNPLAQSALRLHAAKLLANPAKLTPEALAWAKTNVNRRAPVNVPKDCTQCAPVLCSAECREAA